MALGYDANTRTYHWAASGYNYFLGLVFDPTTKTWHWSSGEPADRLRWNGGWWQQEKAEAGGSLYFWYYHVGVLDPETRGSFIIEWPATQDK